MLDRFASLDSIHPLQWTKISAGLETQQSEEADIARRRLFDSTADYEFIRTYYEESNPMGYNSPGPKDLRLGILSLHLRSNSNGDIDRKRHLTTTEGKDALLC